MEIMKSSPLLVLFHIILSVMVCQEMMDLSADCRLPLLNFKYK